MTVDYKRMEISASGKQYPIADFKKWFKRNYNPILARYFVAKNTFDWHSIIADALNNGIMENFINNYETTNLV